MRRCLPLLVLATSCTPDGSKPLEAEPVRVTVQNLGSHFEVRIQGTPGAATGTAYAQALRDTPWSRRADSAITTMLEPVAQELNMSEAELGMFLKQRIDDLLPSLTAGHREELAAFARTAANAEEFKFADGKMSAMEIEILSFLPEVMRLAACSAIGVYGSKTENGNNIVGRVLDWNISGDKNFGKLSAVIHRDLDTRSTVEIGYLGFLPMLTGLNSDGIFVSAFDNHPGAEYVSTNRRSFLFGIRAALESHGTRDGILAAMKSDEPVYAFPFNLLVSDARETVILEAASPFGTHGAGVRTAASPLLDGVLWGHTDAVAMVNSNVLRGHQDTHTEDPSNPGRWESYRTSLTAAAADGTVTFAEVRDMISYRKGPEVGYWGDGEIYNTDSQLLVVFEAASKRLEAWFNTGEDPMPLKPEFERIPLPW